MIKIDRMYKAVLDFLGKNNGQYIPPNDVVAGIHMGSLDYFKELIGGKINNRNVYGLNRILDKRLNPFREDLPITFTGGVAPKPDVAEVIRSLSTTFNGKPKAVRQVEEHRESRTFDNPLADGILEDPVWVESEDEITIYPNSITVGKLKILRLPKEPKWAYTLHGGRTPVYDDANSVDLEWDELQFPQLLMRAVNYLGVPINDSKVVQFSEKEKQSN